MAGRMVAWAAILTVALVVSGCTGRDAAPVEPSEGATGTEPGGLERAATSSDTTPGLTSNASVPDLGGTMLLNLTQPIAQRFTEAPDGPNCLTVKATGSPLVRLNATLDWDDSHPGAATMQLVAYSIQTDRTLATVTGPPPVAMDLPSFQGEDGLWVTLAAQVAPDEAQGVEGLQLNLAYQYRVEEGVAPEPSQASCSVYPPWGYGLFPNG